MIEFPCAVHLDKYDNCAIAVDEKHLKELRELGYITSSEWYAKNLGIISIQAEEATEEPVKRRGRPSKQ